MSLGRLSPELALVDAELSETARGLLSDAGFQTREKEEDVAPDVPHVGNGHSSSATSALPAVTEFATPVQDYVAPATPTVEPEPRVTLETLIFRSGLISPDQLGELAQLHAQTGRPIEELALERGMLALHTLEELLRSQAQSITVAPDPPSEPALRAPIPAGEAAAEPEVSLPAPMEPPAVRGEPVAFHAVPDPEPAVYETSPSEPVAYQAVPDPESAVYETSPSDPVAFHAVPDPEPAVYETSLSEPVPVASRRQDRLAYAVVVSLQGGARLEDGLFGESDEAKSRVSSLVHEFATRSDDWVAVGESLVRPAAALAVSVETRVVDSSTQLVC